MFYFCTPWVSIIITIIIIIIIIISTSLGVKCLLEVNNKGTSTMLNQVVL